jgi:hypothetical protein
MALNYSVAWSGAGFDKFEIQVNTEVTTSVLVDLTTINGDLANIATSVPNVFFNIPLLSIGDLTITIKDIYDERYNSAKLYDSKWVSYVNGGQITTEDLFNNLKNNAKALYVLSRNEASFAEATASYLSDTSTEASRSKFLALIGLRYVLMKIAILLYVSFTVAENPLCDANKNIKDTEAKKQEELNTLVQLLKDTTNLLVNIDAIPVMAVQSAQVLEGGKRRLMV